MSDECDSLPGARLPSRVQRRLGRSAHSIEAEDPGVLLYQHTVLCQCSLPYRDPGPEQRVWTRRNGGVNLRVEAGVVLRPDTDEWVPLGLPYGPKPRLILAYLNREALRYRSRQIDVGESLTAFAKDVLRYFPNGRELHTFRGQLARLCAAQIRLAVAYDQSHTRQINTNIVGGIDLWFPKDERQRVLWPSTVWLSLDYYASLEKHAVPLDERALAALANSALALDLYAWLAQRLHRVEARTPLPVLWPTLKAQFGWHYSSMRAFRQEFRETLGMVLSQYRGARIDMNEHGLVLHHSPPPVKGRLGVTRKA